MNTVLLVDADVLVRHQLAEFLRDCGLKVIEASSSDEARTFLREPGLGIDVALVYAGPMGAKEAFALAQWVRTNASPASVLLVGSPEAAVEKASDLCEQGDDLRKPSDPQVVLNRIKRLLAQRAPPDPERS